MKRVACYARVSTDEQVKFGFSIQAQKDALEKYCKENNYKYDFYVDEGISASSMKKRKALNELLSKANAYDIVLFTKLDRLSRNVLDANNINQLLKDNNCTMKAIDEDDIDTSTADGTFIFNLKVSLAQREIGKTSERINFVFENKREKKEVTSGMKKYCYDIVDKKYVVNTAEAENMVAFFKYFVSVNGNMNKAYSYFIEHFDGKGYDAMSAFLRNTSFIGRYKLYRKNQYIDDYIPRIMDDELFYQVQNLLKRCEKNSKTYSIPSAFAGLIYCGSCGARMTKHQDNRTKIPIMRYRCYNVNKYIVGTNKKVCSNTQIIREDEIEQYLLDNLKKEFEKFKVSTKNRKPIIKDNTQIKKNIEKKINKLKDLYLDDLIDKETYKNDYHRLTNELAKLDVIQETKPNNYLKTTKVLSSNYLDTYNKLNNENKRKFWLSFVDKIIVEDRKITEVTFL